MNHQSSRAILNGDSGIIRGIDLANSNATLWQTDPVFRDLLIEGLFFVKERKLFFFLKIRIIEYINKIEMQCLLKIAKKQIEGEKLSLTYLSKLSPG